MSSLADGALEDSLGFLELSDGSSASLEADFGFFELSEWSSPSFEVAGLECFSEDLSSVSRLEEAGGVVKGWSLDWRGCD